MLTNNRTKKFYKGLYVAIIPLVAVLVMSFQQPAEALVSEVNSGVILQLGSDAQGDPEVGIPSRFPLDEKFRKKITWEFGKEAKNPVTKKLMTHKGVDIAAPLGTAVYATGNGVVAKVTDHESYGKLIVLKHKDGIATFYAHLDSFDVEEGEKVVKGVQIATVGNTGYSTGPHLHYEVRKNGEHLNPADYY